MPPEPTRSGASPIWDGSGRVPQDFIDAGIDRLRDDAVQAARADAEVGAPDPASPESTEAEHELRDRCRAFLQRVRNAERRETAREVAELEEGITENLPKAALSIDRFERITNDLTRLRVRRTTRHREVTQELSKTKRVRKRGIPTNVYLVAIFFLGFVEFFANAPVFSSLLPRDPLTERQIRLLSETSDGWLAGAERVFAQIFLRPDAAFLAAGVIVFLMVLAHFFGHSLRELVIHWDKNARRDRTSVRSPLESAVPLVITGIGLMLTLGVLFEARVMLGDVGTERYEQDIAQVEELRREAVWVRTDGDLLAANQLENRATDLEEAATELREYASSMARMSFPILLLNLTLVLCAIAAAYFHKQDARLEEFNEEVFEDDRGILVKDAEETANEVNTLLAEILRDTRRLRTASRNGTEEWKAVVPQVEAVVSLYRAENARNRGLDSQRIAAFHTPVRMAEANGDEADHGPLFDVDTAEDYERERQLLQSRFDVLRQRFNEESRA
jgi:hypothetical protein